MLPAFGSVTVLLHLVQSHTTFDGDGSGVMVLDSSLGSMTYKVWAGETLIKRLGTVTINRLKKEMAKGSGP